VLVRDEYPETPETIASAKAHQETERAEGIARLLAMMSDVHDLDSQPEHVRQHFGQWGLIAVRGSALGAEQFRLCGLALHASAQAGHDLDAARERYCALDLLNPNNHAERFHWSELATRMIRSWQNVMSGETTHAAKRLYFDRLYPGDAS